MADLTPGDPGSDQNDEAVNGWQETRASAEEHPRTVNLSLTASRRSRMRTIER